MLTPLRAASTGEAGRYGLQMRSVSTNKRRVMFQSRWRRLETLGLGIAMIVCSPIVTTRTCIHMIIRRSSAVRCGLVRGRILDVGSAFPLGHHGRYGLTGWHSAAASAPQRDAKKNDLA